MEKGELHIDEHRWIARFFFAVNGYHTREILASLDEIDCPPNIRQRVFENLEKADMDTGFTYSNGPRRRSVVVIGLTTSPAQFLNSFEHELRHLCDDIAVERGFSMRGEKVAYLIGDINSTLWPTVHQFVCCSCGHNKHCGGADKGRGGY